MATFLNVAYWVIPSAAVTALIVRDEHRIRRARKHRTPKEPS